MWYGLGVQPRREGNFGTAQGRLVGRAVEAKCSGRERSILAEKDRGDNILRCPPKNRSRVAVAVDIDWVCSLRSILFR